MKIFFYSFLLVVISSAQVYSQIDVDLLSSGTAVRIRGTHNGDALRVDSASLSGLYVLNCGWNGLEVNDVGLSGVHISNATEYGLFTSSSGLDGVNVTSAGRYGLYTTGSSNDGIRVDGAGDDGINLAEIY